jgi:hypothetical protein
MISYKDVLLNGLNQLLVDFELDYVIKVFDEKSYTDDVLDPKTIAVVIKYLTGTILYTSTILPVQFMVMAEENSLVVAKMILETYAQNNNFQSVTIGNDFVKQSFSTPTVINNFAGVGLGYRSVIFMNATLTITGSVVDISSLTIDGVVTKFINASVSYNASPDNQPFPNANLNTSVKQFSNFSFSVQVPFTNSVFCQKVLDIMRGQTSGNTKFTMIFSTSTSPVTTFTQSLLMISSVFNTTAGDLPTLQISFVR